MHSQAWDALQQSVGEMPPVLLRECKEAWCSPQGLTASLVTSKNTRETAVSQGTWLLDFTGTHWLPGLLVEPFQGLTVTGQRKQISTVLRFQ